MLLPSGIPVLLVLPHSGPQHPMLFILSKEIKGKVLEEAWGTWGSGEGSRVGTKGKNRLCPYTCISCPIIVCGFTKTVEGPLSYFTSD